MNIKVQSLIVLLLGKLFRPLNALSSFDNNYCYLLSLWLFGIVSDIVTV